MAITHSPPRRGINRAMVARDFLQDRQVRGSDSTGSTAWTLLTFESHAGTTVGALGRAYRNPNRMLAEPTRTQAKARHTLILQRRERGGVPLIPTCNLIQAVAFEMCRCTGDIHSLGNAGGLPRCLLA